MEIEKRRKHQWWYGTPATCAECNKGFGAQRITALYCSDACKQKAYRKAKEAKKEAEKQSKRLQQSFALVFTK